MEQLVTINGSDSSTLISMADKPVDAFLGSSVKPLKDGSVVDGDQLTKHISTFKPIIRTERLLRQYYKGDSCKLWSFHLESAHARGRRSVIWRKQRSSRCQQEDCACRRSKKGVSESFVRFEWKKLWRWQNNTYHCKYVKNEYTLLHNAVQIL